MENTFLNHVLLLVILLAVSVQAEGGVNQYDMNDSENIFEKFMADFKKSYKDQEDQDIHFEHFKENLEVINELNEKHYPDTTFSVNRFSDYSKEEMRKWFASINN